MPTKHIENTTNAPIYVGGKMIPPGTGRDIDISLLPPEHQEGPAAPVLLQTSIVDEVEGLRAQSVKIIVEQLPTLTQEAYDLLVEAEKAQNHPRVTLMTALEAEAIRRADAALKAQADAEQSRQLAELTDEQRAALGQGGGTTDTPPAA